jgi:hypothetical protein
MHTVALMQADVMSDEDADALAGAFINIGHYDRVVRGTTTTVLKPDGKTLLTYIDDAIPDELCGLAKRVFKNMPLSSNNRSLAAGGRITPTKRNGVRSRTSQSRTVPSDVVGYLDASKRNGSCRMSALTIDHYPAFKAAQPFFEEVSRQFERFAPERWAAQQRFINEVTPNRVIPRTAFTTVTVNRNWRTAVHPDAHDYRPGFGVMMALGRWDGGVLIFPKYRIAVDMRPGGLLLADVHELHGNGPLDVAEGQQRLSFVFYARANMHLCGSAADEVERGKTLAQ